MELHGCPLCHFVIKVTMTYEQLKMYPSSTSSICSVLTYGLCTNLISIALYASCIKHVHDLLYKTH